MNQVNDIDLLGRLLAEIERAWVDSKDHMAVNRLSREYPQFRDELHEFFSDLILGPEGPPTSDVLEAEDDVHHWILASGLNIAESEKLSALRTTSTAEPESKQRLEAKAEGAGSETAKATTPGDNWIGFLRQQAKLKLPQLAAALPHVTTEYLVLVSRYPSVVPAKVKKVLANYAEEKFGIRREDSLRCLASEGSFRIAASRTQPFDSEPKTFEELLDRSALDPDQKAFWLNCA